MYLHKQLNMYEDFAALFVKLNNADDRNREMIKNDAITYGMFYNRTSNIRRKKMIFMCLYL